MSSLPISKIPLQRPTKLWSRRGEMVLDSPRRLWHYQQCLPVGPCVAGGS
jgi:hypothetical protein